MKKMLQMLLGNQDYQATKQIAKHFQGGNQVGNTKQITKQENAGNH